LRPRSRYVRTFIVDDAAYAAAVAEVTGPRRRLALLTRSSPRVAWESLVSSGEHVSDALPEQMAERLAAARCHAVWTGGPNYPPLFADDPHRPAVLFVRGSLEVLASRRVGLIGTRAATAAGRATASMLGDELSRAGVTVVSGLARGIDGAAHRGAVAAVRQGATGHPFGVVACGLDVMYPREHAALYDDVASCGAIVSEWAPGTPPDSFRFPLRNRILAAACEVVVVVESREAGGSMITVEEAAVRGIPVMSVPGSPRNATSAGANLLLQQGCAPVLDVNDVLMALGLDHARVERSAPRERPLGDDGAVLAACGGGAMGLDDVMLATGFDVSRAALALGRLEALGWIVRSGAWWEVLVASES